MQFYVTEQLGPKQSLTPEGYLLVTDVPLARTGDQLYAAGEVPLTPGKDGTIRVDRPENEVFRPETVASFAGKSVVNDHPRDPSGVTPQNWRQLTVGVVLNPRRGTGIDDQLLLGDLMITDAQAIAAVRAGKRQVSCGYDADYEEIEPGRGRQHNIIGNHVALVEAGRCGARCAIGDEDTMAEKTWLQKIREAFATNDGIALETALASAPTVAASEPSGDTHVHVHVGTQDKAKDEDPDADKEKTGDEDPEDKKDKSMDAAPDWFKSYASSTDKRMDSFEETLKKLTGDKAKDEDPDADKEKTGDEDPEDDKEKKTGDSVGLAEEFKDTVARAEILAPGIKLPTFDAKMTTDKTADAMCQLRRKALITAHASDDGKKIIEPLLAGKTVDAIAQPAMTCDAVKILFLAASEMKRAATNRGLVSSRVIEKARTGDKKGPPSLAEINAANRKFFGQPAG